MRAWLAVRAVAPCRLVFVGSSTTAGNNATTAANRYVNRLVASLQAAYPSGLGTEQAVIASDSATFGALSSAAGVHGYNAGQAGTTSATYLTAAEALAEQHVVTLCAVGPDGRHIVSRSEDH